MLNPVISKNALHKEITVNIILIGIIIWTKLYFNININEILNINIIIVHINNAKYDPYINPTHNTIKNIR